MRLLSLPCCHLSVSRLKKRKRPAAPAPAASSALPPGISFAVITNDGTPQNSVWLMGAKKIFATQLPKMPREYIVRLVMDRKHKTMVLLKDGKKPVVRVHFRGLLFTISPAFLHRWFRVTVSTG